jgi:hypothetical protein
MVRAVIKNGQISPVDPLPEEWVEGTELKVDAETNGHARAGEDPWDELEAWVQGNAPETGPALHKAINEIRQQAKEMAKQGKW